MTIDSSTERAQGNHSDRPDPVLIPLTHAPGRTLRAPRPDRRRPARPRRHLRGRRGPRPGRPGRGRPDPRPEQPGPGRLQVRGTPLAGSDRGALRPTPAAPPPRSSAATHRPRARADPAPRPARRPPTQLDRGPRRLRPRPGVRPRHRSGRHGHDVPRPDRLRPDLVRRRDASAWPTSAASPTTSSTSITTTSASPCVTGTIFTASRALVLDTVLRESLHLEIPAVRRARRRPRPRPPPDPRHPRPLGHPRPGPDAQPRVPLPHPRPRPALPRRPPGHPHFRVAPRHDAFPRQHPTPPLPQLDALTKLLASKEPPPR